MVAIPQNFEGMKAENCPRSSIIFTLNLNYIILDTYIAAVYMYIFALSSILVIYLFILLTFSKENISK